MATTIQYHAGQQATFTHPRELRLLGTPEPPKQPIADYPDLASDFGALAAKGAAPRELLGFLEANHVRARPSDCPEPGRSALQTYLRDTMTHTPDTLDSSEGAWR